MVPFKAKANRYRWVKDPQAYSQNAKKKEFERRVPVLVIAFLPPGQGYEEGSAVVVNKLHSLEEYAISDIVEVELPGLQWWSHDTDPYPKEEKRDKERGVPLNHEGL